MKAEKKVAIVLRLSGTAGREILSGIFLFTRANPHWRTRLFQMPDELTPDQFKSLQADGYDGLVMSEPGPKATAALIMRSDIPVSFIGAPGPILDKRDKHIVHIRNDDEYIGELGARYLLSLGSRRALGFIPTTSHQYWSEARQRGFLHEISKRGLSCSIFQSPTKAGTNADLSALRKWLKSLPKPAALMAAWDTRATQTIQACLEAKIKIPDQVAIIGVDNDELLDESTIPPLSSIQPDHEKLGYVAARELELLMSGRKPKHQDILLTRPLRLVERESAAASAPAAHIITRAMDYIRKNATKGIHVDDVARNLGISRRLADLRFQQFSGETINEAITQVRLNEVKKLLATTTRTIKSISIACGYADQSYLKTLFKRRVGMTMRDWRNSQFSM